MEKIFKTREELLNAYDVSSQLLEMENILLENSWHTNFGRFSFEEQGKYIDGFIMRAELYPYLWVEYMSDNGITLQEINITLFDSDMDYFDSFNISDNKKRIFMRLDDLEEIEYKKSIPDWYTIDCDRYHEWKDNR